ncbi:MAG: amylo-alpha-1,6-glucosidase [Archangium sp.]|nr:amylo-alpha-1,6-glucosidase [Archangium sp.]MDP3570613.1 amylo-alpha-1,6-glucosidase [Archangium sp.]
MEEVIRVQDHYYILATSSRADGRTRVLKDEETFAIFDDFGDVVPLGLGEQGIYHEGTRYLSRLELRVNGRRPLLLSSTVRDQNDLLVVDLTNPDIRVSEDSVFRRDILHLFRSKFLFRGSCFERLRLTNHGLDPVTLKLSMRFSADFADIFEVRGTARPRRGKLLDPVAREGVLVLGYDGLDGTHRQTTIECFPKPQHIDGTELTFELMLGPQTSETIYCTVSCELGEVRRQGLAYDHALGAASNMLAEGRARRPEITTGNERFNTWLARSSSDLSMMLTQTTHGLYPYAGVPWFSTVFGRDGIITALQMLWLDPSVARGVLGFLAANQATETNALQDSEPGKILHETRRGEMAALGEIPFGRYYGSIDSTPLFVLLAGAYYERTGDRALIESIWPQIVLALRWIDTYGDRDQDGFVEYMRHTPEGLAQQGWKDSHDSVFHASGEMAEPPIALCEVQAYVYQAKRRAAELAHLLGHEEHARTLRTQAESLRVRFEEKFWSEELGTYVIALDGQKRPCEVRSSNAGHCLFGNIASPEHASRTVATLMGEDMFSGWGVRTLGTNQRRYNPMSYHNGSVWPHDNALIARGFANYGSTDAATALFKGLFDLSQFVDLTRVPELVCGFTRRPAEGPTRYPVACAPQAWAAAAVYMLLQSSLGMLIRAPQQQLLFERSMLPDFLPWVRISNLKVGEASIDVLLERHELDVGIRVLRRSGDVQIIAIK